MALSGDVKGKPIDNWLKILAIVGFGLIIPALLLLHNSPAEGYELSIYSATPTAAWVCLILSLCIGIFILTHQAFAEVRSNLWLIGILLVVSAIFTLLIIPPLRGYFAFWSGDPLIHIGMVKDIIADGYFGGGNRYPITHLLVAMDSQICNISPMWGAGYLLPFISILFILSTFLLARVILPNKGQVLLAIAASAILFYGTAHASLYPHTLSLLMLPWVFYFYMKGLEKPLWQNKLLLILSLVFYPFVYPPTALIITMSLLLAELIRWGLGKRFTPHVKSSIWLGPALISFIVLFLWASRFYGFNTVIITAWGWLRGETITIPYIAATQEMIYPVLGKFGIAELVLKQYGDNIALVLLSLIAMVFIIRRISQAEMWRPFLAVVLFILSGVLSIVFFMTILAVSVGRLLSLNYAMWVTPILAGFILYELFRRRSRVRVVAVSGILIILSLVGIFGLYTSPNVNQPSPQLTYMNIEANNWLHDHAVPVYTATTMGYYFNTVSDLFGHVARTPEGERIFFGPRYDDPKVGIPEHFGYSQQERLGDSVSERFLVLTEGFRDVSILLNHPNSKMYSGGLLGSARFNEDDFAGLELDPTVAKLYSNKEADVWYISSPE